MTTKQKNSPKESVNNFIRYSSLSMEMMGIIALFTFLGVKLDRWMGNQTMWFTIVLLFLSVAGAIYHAIRKILKQK